MSLFRKPKRNFRQRTAKHDSDEENNSAADFEKHQGGSDACEIPFLQETSGKSSDKRSVKKPEKKCANAFALSFEHDDEEEESGGEIFKVKKSTYSRRLMKQLEKERKKKTTGNESGNVGIDGSISVKEENPYTSMQQFNPETKPKRNEKQEQLLVMNGDDVEEMELDSTDDDQEKVTADPFRKILESGSIPDAAMIHAARKRRQMAREASEFISVEDNENTEKSNSRLIRDDDNDRSDDDDDDEHRGRISFSVMAPQAKDRAREALLALSQKDGDAGSDEEADEELERWEQEQIRKGVSIPQVPSMHPLLPPQPDTQVYPPYAYPSPELPTSAAPLPPPHPPPPIYSTDPYIPAPLPEVKREPPPPMPTTNRTLMTVAGFKSEMKKRLESHNEVFRAHNRECEKIKDDLVSRENRILDMKEKSPQVARTFAFYQEMRGYVTDLVECLDEKIVKINQLDASMMQLLKQRALRLVQRCQQDVKDQSEEFSSMFGKQTSVVMSLLDPFNRDKPIDQAKARRAAEREGRRSRRRRARESRGTNVKHYEGMSSDDEEMEADIAHFNAEKERLLEEAAHVFDDVVEEFHCISAIKTHFEQWKEKYPESYTNAYIGLCVPKVFTPFVRLQMISWNPLEESCDFEESVWFESLMFYGYNDRLTSENLRTDSDSMLIPHIVERVILPRLAEMAEHVWDPMSTSQTLRFVNLMRKLIDEYPTVNGKSKKTQCVLEAVLQRMRRCLDEDVYMPPYPKSVLENKSSSAYAFFQRQYWSCVKLLRNLLSWQGIVDDHRLQEIALDGLLTRYLLWAMHNSAVNKDTLEKAKMVTATIPRSWFAKRTNDSTIPQLEMFCRYLKATADAMDKSASLGSVADKLEAKESIKDIVKMMTQIGALDHALIVANQFSIKDPKMRSLTTAIIMKE